MHTYGHPSPGIQALPYHTNSLTLAIVPEALGYVLFWWQDPPLMGWNQGEVRVGPGNGLGAIWAGSFGVLVLTVWSIRKEEHRPSLPGPEESFTLWEKRGWRGAKVGGPAAQVQGQ